MDLNRLDKEIRFLPDEVLKKEMNNPSGLIPGWMALAELADRDAIRQSGAPAKPQPSIASRYFSEGGLVADLNPFIALTEQMQNPELQGQMLQEKLAALFGGQPPLMPTMPTMAPGGAPGLSGLNPLPAGTPKQPDQMKRSGIAGLMR